MPERVLLASGGLDSCVLAHWLEAQGLDFVPLFVDYGQHCREQEYQTLLQVLPLKYQSLVETLDVSAIYLGSTSRLIKAPDLWTDHVVAEDFYLPYRNLLLLSVAAAWAQARGIGQVYAAFINSNHAKEIDATARFLEDLERMLKDYGGVRVLTPFREFSKSQVAAIGLSLGAPIALTFSCQANTQVHCGACPNCVERLKALSDAMEQGV